MLSVFHFTFINNDNIYCFESYNVEGQNPIQAMQEEVNWIYTVYLRAMWEEVNWIYTVYLSTVNIDKSE